MSRSARPGCHRLIFTKVREYVLKEGIISTLRDLDILKRKNFNDDPMDRSYLPMVRLKDKPWFRASDGISFFWNNFLTF